MRLGPIYPPLTNGNWEGVETSGRARQGCRSPRAGPAVCGPVATVAVLQAEQSLRPFLLEIQSAGRRRRNPADAPAEIRDVRAHSRIGKYPQAEGEPDRADVIPSLQRQADRDGGEVGVGELAVRGHLDGPARLARLRGR